MSWFKKKSKLKMTGATLAELLYRIYVKESDFNGNPNTYRIPQKFHGEFRSKVIIYRSAVVLAALIYKSRENSVFQQALDEYECILLKLNHNTLDCIRVATLDLGIIITPSDDPNLRWSQKWFVGIGYNEVDPIAWGAFTMSWMHLYIAAHDSISAMVE